MIKMFVTKYIIAVNNCQIALYGQRKRKKELFRIILKDLSVIVLEWARIRLTISRTHHLLALKH